MTVDTYTTAIDKIHAPELSVERAIKAAKARAAARASAQLKTRYTAAAASIALATAGGMMFYLFGKEQPPVSPLTVITATESNTESADSAETKPAQSKTEAATAADKPTQTQSSTSETAAETRSVTEPTTAERQPETQKRAETPSPTEAQAPTQNADQPTVTPTIADSTEPYIPEDPDIDSSLLGDDGKVYFMIASVGLDKIEGEEAFTDDHIYYIETKFGRWEYNPLPWLAIQPYDKGTSGKTYYYYYSSDGTILYQEVR